MYFMHHIPPSVSFHPFSSNLSPPIYISFSAFITCLVELSLKYNFVNLLGFSLQCQITPLCLSSPCSNLLQPPHLQALAQNKTTEWFWIE